MVNQQVSVKIQHFGILVCDQVVVVIVLHFLGVNDSKNSVCIFFNTRVHVFQRPCTKICTNDIGGSTPACPPGGVHRSVSEYHRGTWVMFYRFSIYTLSVLVSDLSPH